MRQAHCFPLLSIPHPTLHLLICPRTVTAVAFAFVWGLRFSKRLAFGGREGRDKTTEEGNEWGCENMRSMDVP
jgi:hypothetical protein